MSKIDLCFLVSQELCNSLRGRKKSDMNDNFRIECVRYKMYIHERHMVFAQVNIGLMIGSVIW